MMSAGTACRSRLLELKSGITVGAAQALQQWRGMRMKEPIEERYEVLEPNEAHRMRNEMERRKENIIERYNKTVRDERTPGKSFRMRSEKYMRPFTLDVHMSSKYIHANVMHRTQHRVVAAVATNSKDMRALLPSRCDLSACRIVGETLAERAKEADCYSVVYQPRKMERLEGKLAAVLEAVANSGISIYHSEKGIMLVKD